MSVILAVIPINNNNIVVTQLIAEILEHGNITKKKSCQMIRQVANKPTV